MKSPTIKMSSGTILSLSAPKIPRLANALSSMTDVALVGPSVIKWLLAKTGATMAAMAEP